MDPREFHWLIHDECNYSCPYCPRAGGKRTPGPAKRSPRGAADWLAAWERIRGCYGRCRIYITGGEPTLFPDFCELVHGLSSMHEVVFDTNLAWSMEDIRAFCGKVSPERVKVNLSFHPHSADAGEFIGKARFLRERGFGAACRVVAYPPLLPELEGLCDIFGKAGLELAVTPFRGEHSGSRYPRAYTEEERSVISSLNSRLKAGSGPSGFQAGITHRIIYPRMIPITGEPCRSGQVYCCVEHDGTVYRCMQYAHREQESIGNVLDPSFRLTEGPSPCGMRYCEYERKYLVRRSWPRQGEAG